MSAQANFFKLGLFVIGATIVLILLLLILGSGRWFQSKVTIETYLNESAQGLEVGSKVKYRGVVVGEVTKIGFTYTKYQLDKPMADRLRYVMIEALLLAAPYRRARKRRYHPAGDRADGNRQGLARAACAAGHHRDELPRDRLRRSRRPIPSCRFRGSRTTSTFQARSRR